MYTRQALRHAFGSLRPASSLTQQRQVRPPTQSVSARASRLWEDPLEFLRKGKLSSRAQDPRGVALPMIFSKANEEAPPAFGKLWLRDHCQCSNCIHPDTKQRIVNTFWIPQDIDCLDVTTEDETVVIKWSDGHVGRYPFYFLRQYLPSDHSAKRNLKRFDIRPFHAYEAQKTKYPTVSYTDVMGDDTSLLDWLEKIYQWGFCFVKDTPINPEATEALLKRIAFIRTTHYGGFWDFTADLTFKDTAYTNEFLGAHTDNTYFTDPARLQLFHLLSHENGDGGASLLVDGFQAVQHLLNENWQHAKTLRITPQPAHASGNEDHCITPSRQFPVLILHSDMHYLYQIRWNNYDRAPKWNWTIDEQYRWYEAAKHFDEILRRPSMEIWTQLEPGTALIFDNWRMLHGRSEFTGKRRMCGGYINGDDFISRYRLLKFGRDYVLGNLGNIKHRDRNPFNYV
ncbi:putative trimethyllysine dioxygenase [Aspergillus heterothallicus]